FPVSEAHSANPVLPISLLLLAKLVGQSCNCGAYDLHPPRRKSATHFDDNIVGYFEPPDRCRLHWHSCTRAHLSANLRQRRTRLLMFKNLFQPCDMLAPIAGAPSRLIGSRQKPARNVVPDRSRGNAGFLAQLDKVHFIL